MHTNFQLLFYNRSQNNPLLFLYYTSVSPKPHRFQQNGEFHITVIIHMFTSTITRSSIIYTDGESSIMHHDHAYSNPEGGLDSCPSIKLNFLLTLTMWA